jgi:hypothetical protein
MKQLPIPIPNADVLCGDVADGWAVLVNVDSAASIALNATGVAIWQLVDGRRSVSDIVMALAAQFRNVPPSMESDVVSLLDRFAEQGFVGYEVVQ